jgi:hypothetical protein
MTRPSPALALRRPIGRAIFADAGPVTGWEVGQRAEAIREREGHGVMGMSETMLAR